MGALLFWGAGAAMVLFTLLTVSSRNPVYSAIWMILSFAATAGLFVLLDAHLIAVVEVLVYAGAIMVLFLFVVMLLNAPHEDTEEDLETPGLERRRLAGAGVRRFGGLLAVALIVELWWALTKNGGESGAFPAAAEASVAAIGRSLFTDYAFPFEVTSILILVAMVGAVVLARREPLTPAARRPEPGSPDLP